MEEENKEHCCACNSEEWNWPMAFGRAAIFWAIAYSIHACFQYAHP